MASNVCSFLHPLHFPMEESTMLCSLFSSEFHTLCTKFIEKGGRNSDYNQHMLN